MAKKKHAKDNGGEVLDNAKETAAIEQYWHLAGRPKRRKPPKNYKYVEELAHLEVELIKLQEWVRLRGLKVGNRRGQGADLALSGGLVGQKAGDLSLKTGNPALRVGQFTLAGGQLVGKRGDKGRLPVTLGLRFTQTGLQRPDLLQQFGRLGLLQPQGIGQLRNLRTKLVKLGALRGDRVAQNRLHDSKDGQNEHQHHQKGRHGVDETGPDVGTFAAARQAHDQPRPTAPRDRARMAVVKAVKSARRSAMLS